MRCALFGLLAVINFMLASASRVASIIDESKVQDATWEIEVIEGQPPVEFTGTVQMVMAQLKEEYPDFAAKAQKRINDYLASLEVSSKPESALSKRDNTICNTFTWANRDRINEGIAYLYGLKHKPNLRPGPGACDRVSCSWRSAIWVCNDNNFAKPLGSFGDIANAARVVCNDCSYFFADGGWQVNGQRFHNDKVNVIVRGSDC